MLIQNAHCHDSWTSPPPSAGPSAAATAPVMAHRRAAGARFSGDSAARSRPRLAGVIAAAPTAWRARKATSHQIPGANPHARLAATKMVMPTTNPPFCPDRSASRPIGTSSAA